MEIRYPQYFRVKCYNGNSVRLRIISICIKKYQQAFLVLLPRISCCIIFEPSSPVYTCVLPLKRLFFFLLQWSNIPFKKNLSAPKDKFLWGTTIEANQSFWLWTLSWLYNHGSGTNLLRLSLWKLLSSSMGVWAALCMLDHFGHVTRKPLLEVASFLS